ncbi:MAG: ribokinase [Defluviitaleaceae bacterium]|nr:ribokinase [Defluviitaleaceae bacterium]
MKVLSFGSLNYDYVYSVPRIARAGESINSTNLEVFCGGKGLNQSVALSRAGIKVFHAGFVGPDGEKLIEACQQNGIDPRYILSVFEHSGNAIIQVSDAGENSVMLFSGANQCNTAGYVDSVISDFDAQEIILLQNDVNRTDYIIEKAYEKGMRIFFNPTPINRYADNCDLTKVDTLIVNEKEGAHISGEKEEEKILAAIKAKYPKLKVLLTLGARGVIYQDNENIYRHRAYDVPFVDAAAAGDTFIGHFVGATLKGKDIPQALRLASIAAAISVTKKGAVNSIPTLSEVLASDLASR